MTNEDAIACGRDLAAYWIAVRAAALRPPVFRALVEQGFTEASQGDIAAHLRTVGFRRMAALKCSVAFVETMQFVGLRP